MYTKKSKGIITTALLMFLTQRVTYIFTHHVMVNNNLDCLNKEEKVVTFNIWYTHITCILLDMKMQQLDPTIKHMNRGGSAKTSDWPNSFPKKNCFMTLCTVFKCINKHGKVQILNTYNTNITLFIHANAKDLFGSSGGGSDGWGGETCELCKWWRINTMHTVIS